MKFKRMILIFYKGKCARIAKPILKRNYRARARQQHLLENKIKLYSLKRYVVGEEIDK